MLDASVSYYFGGKNISKLVACTIYITAWKTIVQLVHLLSDGLTHDLWSDGGWVDSFADLGWVGVLIFWWNSWLQAGLEWPWLGQLDSPPYGPCYSLSSSNRLAQDCGYRIPQECARLLEAQAQNWALSLLPHSVTQNKSNYKANLVSRDREELQSQGSIREAEE